MTVSNTATKSSLRHDRELASIAGRDARRAILRSINEADAAHASSLLRGLEMTALHGYTSEAEIREDYPRCNNPGVYHSTFNRGAKCAEVLGIAATVELIAACNTAPGAFRRASEALALAASTVGKQLRDGGIKALNKRATASAVKVAVAAATAKMAEKKKAGKKAAEEKKEPAKRALVRRTKAQVELAEKLLASGQGYKEMASALKLASNTASRMPEGDGRETMHREACAALARACELFHILAK